MGKKRGKMTTKRNRIVKNHDIEEMVEKAEMEETEQAKEIKNLEDVISKIDEEKNNFKGRIILPENDKIISNEQSDANDKKLEAVSRRKDMQLEIEKRKEDLLRTISKIEEKEKQEKEEQQR